MRKDAQRQQFGACFADRRADRAKGVNSIDPGVLTMGAVMSGQVRLEPAPTNRF